MEGWVGGMEGWWVGGVEGWWDGGGMKSKRSRPEGGSQATACCRSP